MKRLGKEYLEETLGDKLKEIADRDPDCEVDPNRISNANELDRNWRRLIKLAEDCWECINRNATRCPHELRYIFRHIRACAEDRYGDFLRTVSYSSVSGFLFLRFFCPAILNPKLFGLVKDHPKANARRAFTLIAKAIQGLANMSNFGAKELWMEPMNAFLTSHRQDFKNFLDTICSISSTARPYAPMPPSYSTPLLMLERLPSTGKEGFPSLPYLIDHARNHAALVNLVLDYTKDSALQDTESPLRKFHTMCQQLRKRTEECLAKAERAERPTSVLSSKLEELREELEAQKHRKVGNGAGSGSSDLPDSPSRTDSQRQLSLQMPPFESKTPRPSKSTATHSPATSPATSPNPPSDGAGGGGDDSRSVDTDTTPQSAGGDGHTAGFGFPAPRETWSSKKDNSRRPREKDERKASTSRQIPAIAEWQASALAAANIGRSQTPNSGGAKSWDSSTAWGATAVPLDRFDRNGSGVGTGGGTGIGTAGGIRREKRRIAPEDLSFFNSTPSLERPQSSESPHDRDHREGRSKLSRQYWNEARHERDGSQTGKSHSRSREAIEALASANSRPSSRPGTQPTSEASSDNEAPTALPRIRRDRDRYRDEGERERDRERREERERNQSHLLERVGLRGFGKRKQ